MQPRFTEAQMIGILPQAERDLGIDALREVLG